MVFFSTVRTLLYSVPYSGVSVGCVYVYVSCLGGRKTAPHTPRARGGCSPAGGRSSKPLTVGALSEREWRSIIIVLERARGA